MCVSFLTGHRCLLADLLSLTWDGIIEAVVSQNLSSQKFRKAERRLSEEYPLSAMRLILGTNKETVASAKAIPYPQATHTDKAMTAELEFPTEDGNDNIKGKLSIDLQVKPSYGFIPELPFGHVRVFGEMGDAELENFQFPSLYHIITGSTKPIAGGKEERRTETAYTFKDRGEPHWTT